MHRSFIVFGSLLIAFLAGAVFAQTRTITADAAGYRSGTATIEALPDGGCLARWCGAVVDSEGQEQRACTDSTELRSSTNRNRCAGLLEAGAPRVLRELRFAVDGGAP